MNPPRSNSTQRGFTLVEIAVVLLIVGILASLAVAAIGMIKNKAAESLIENNLRQLYQAKEYYFSESGNVQQIGVSVLANLGYLRKSQIYNLYKHGAMETHMGWHYDPFFYPGDPVGAQRLPDGGTIADSTASIYYPAAPPGGGFNRSGQKLFTAYAARTQPPQVTVPPTTPPVLKEDGAHTFTQDQLLAMVGVHSSPQNPVSINQVTVDPAQGTISRGPGGTWVFTPAANFHGTGVPLNIRVGNRNGETDTQATLDVTPVTDPATVSVSATARQDVVTTGNPADLGRIQIDQIKNPPTTEFSLEFTVIGKAVPDTGASSGPVVVNIGTPGNNNFISLWNPGNMKVGGAGDQPTGINLGDGDSHRITLTWDSASGDLKVFDNGELKTTIQNWKKGESLPPDMYAVLGGKMNNPRTQNGFNQGEHYEGQIFNTALARVALGDDAVRQAPLASQISSGTGLVFDVRSVGGQLEDTTGHHQVATRGGLGHATTDVDTQLGVTPPGSLLRLGVQPRPSDPADRVAGVAVAGLLQGTVLSDGTHRVVIQDPNQPVDVSSWQLDQIAAQLPAGDNGNMRLDVVVTTQGPDGTRSLAVHSEQVTLNPAATAPSPRTYTQR